MSSLLLIDCSNFIHRALHIHQHLSCNGVPTGGLYGYIQQFVKIWSAVKPSCTAVCFDLKPYLRSALYPDYKAQRAVKSALSPSMLPTSKKLVDEFSQVLGVPIYQHQGVEADDWFGLLTDRYHGEFEYIYIASADTDLYQLLQYQNVVLIGNKGKQYTRRDFDKEFPGIEPIDWITVTALEGGHNGVPGFKGIGTKTAVKIVREGLFEKYREKTPETFYEVLERNEYLAVLPYPEVEDLGLDLDLASRTGNYSYREMLNFLLQYDIVIQANWSYVFDNIGYTQLGGQNGRKDNGRLAGEHPDAAMF